MRKSKNITRVSISDEIAKEVDGLSLKDSQRVVDSILRGIRDSLTKGQEVKISGFGKFVLQTKNPRKGRNPKTGEPILIPGRRVTKFKPSDVFREEMNNNHFGGNT